MGAKHNWNKLASKFLVLDGPDGCGKTTQQERLAAALRENGLSVTTCRDPGGTAIGDRIRHVLLDFDLAEMDVRCEMLLFMASRAQLVGQIIRPALERGDCVVCSRFISATCAYQGAAGSNIDDVLTIGRAAVGDTWPDLTLVLDVPIEEGFRRTGRSAQKHVGRAGREAGQAKLFDGVQPDAMESRSNDFHRRVRENMLALPTYYPKPVVVVDANAPIDDVHARVLEAVASAAR